MKTVGRKGTLLLVLLLLCAATAVWMTGKLVKKQKAPQPEESISGENGKEYFILGTSDTVEGLEPGQVLTDQGICEMEEGLAKQFLYDYVRIQGDGLPPKADPDKTASFAMHNVYILEASETQVTVLYENYPVCLPACLDMTDDFLQVADLTMENGSVTAIRLKKETIRGAVLAVYDRQVELEGYGLLPLAEDFHIYETYDAIREQDTRALVVGYDIARFVVADGMVCAGIVEASPDLEKIRVVLHTTDYQSLYHEKLVIVPDTDVSMITEAGASLCPAGEEIVFLPEYLDMGERIRLVPTEEKGKQTVKTILRSQGNPSYAGTLEINRRKEGLLLVNELGVEAYLCAVVPSEMPASYEEEALKAQAVCARSYAYQQISQGRYQAFGAHVDDSVDCQVYHNCAPQEKTTRAVYETAGQVARYEGEVILAYYFSTSGGTTTSGAVWGESGADVPYLKAKEVLDENGEAYEKEEPWYHWQAKAGGEIYLEGIEARTGRLLQESPQLVRVKQKDGSYVSLEDCREEAVKKNIQAGKLGKICSIREGERLEGGVLNRLLIDGERLSVEVRTEYAIRKVLGDASLTLQLADGSSRACPALLPSAFFSLHAQIDTPGNGEITITGGGYGHGVGMSQNGANRMAKAGKNYREILEFFYTGITL